MNSYIVPAEIVDQLKKVNPNIDTTVFPIIDHRDGRRCEHCHAKTNRSEHTLTRGMVRGLIKFANASIEKRERACHPRKDTKANGEPLEHDERSNWTKLRFFGLVTKYKVDGVHKEGKWIITRNGWAFLRNDLAVHQRVKTFRNQLVERSEELITFQELMTDTELPYYPQDDMYFSEPATDADFEQVKTYKKRGRKKRNKEYCPKCDAEMKKTSKAQITENQTAIVSWFWNCTECDYLEPI